MPPERAWGNASSTRRGQGMPTSSMSSVDRARIADRERSCVLARSTLASCKRVRTHGLEGAHRILCDDGGPFLHDVERRREPPAAAWTTPSLGYQANQTQRGEAFAAPGLTHDGHPLTASQRERPERVGTRFRRLRRQPRGLQGAGCRLVPAAVRWKTFPDLRWALFRSRGVAVNRPLRHVLPLGGRARTRTIARRSVAAGEVGR